MSNDWGNDWSDLPPMGSQQPPHQQQQQAPQYQPYGGYSDGGSNYYQQHAQSQPMMPPQQNFDYYGQSNANANAGFGFNPQTFMADPMLQAARQFGGQFAEQQKEKITKYLTGFNLKYYFAVDNTYVGKKLGILLFPFIHSDWSLKYGGSEDPAPAKEDVNAPDLYIPLMAFITYIIVSGFVLGTQGR
ncbi:Hrf1 family protein [Oesophagostomum dentatum]|uniref:Protein YIF1 n=1 Tax=Oesophagostomum dentatum TaxID=61180 RepID=A0A0B1RWB3_OESDE|nr:Hrf1 family protein [Oesophagostomum dentatum]